MKASQRRALNAAVGAVRCPSCNHPRLLVMTLDPLALWCSCGWHGPASAEFASRPSRGGHRTTATVQVDVQAAVQD